jgi:hypothetical protein
MIIAAAAEAAAGAGKGSRPAFDSAAESVAEELSADLRFPVALKGGDMKAISSGLDSVPSSTSIELPLVIARRVARLLDLRAFAGEGALVSSPISPSASAGAPLATDAAR